jgi:hypothetical protein
MHKTRLGRALFPVLFPLLAMLAGTAAAGGRCEHEWSEEVVLADGRTVIVERVQQRQEPADKSVPCGLVERERLLAKKWGKPVEWSGEGVRPLILMDIAGAPAVVAAIDNCAAWDRLGRPNPPFLVEQLKDGHWQRIDPLQNEILLQRNLVQTAPAARAPELQALLEAAGVHKGNKRVHAEDKPEIRRIETPESLRRPDYDSAQRSACSTEPMVQRWDEDMVQPDLSVARVAVERRYVNAVIWPEGRVEQRVAGSSLYYRRGLIAVRWRYDGLEPLRIDEVDGSVQVLSLVTGCAMAAELGNPAPPYVLHRWNGRDWDRVPILPHGIARERNLLAAPPAGAAEPVRVEFRAKAVLLPQQLRELEVKRRGYTEDAFLYCGG